LCVDTAESGAEWPFVRINPAFVRAQFVCARESCICAGLSTGHKYKDVRAQTESASGLKPEKNPNMIPNHAHEKNVTRKVFLRLTPAVSNGRVLQTRGSKVDLALPSTLSSCSCHADIQQDLAVRVTRNCSRVRCWVTGRSRTSARPSVARIYIPEQVHAMLDINQRQQLERQKRFRNSIIKRFCSSADSPCSHVLVYYDNFKSGTMPFLISFILCSRI
jgi:hypothetical protein